MRKEVDGSFTYSPSDLIVFMESPFASWMDRYHAESPNEAARDRKHATDTLLQQRGTEHEVAYLNALKSKGLDVVEVARTAAAEPATLTAMQDGHEVIYQGYLRFGQFAGWSDFLLKVPGNSAFGEFSYEIWDTKLSTKPKPYFLIQLCCYAEMLEQIQGILPESVGIVLGSGRQRKFRTLDYYYFYLSLKDQFLRYQQNFDLDNRPMPGPSENFGDWEALAQEILLAHDHLSQVANIRCTQIKKLEAAGVTTMSALAAFTGRIPNMEKATLTTLIHQGRLQVESKGLSVPKFEVLHHVPGERRGLALLAPSSELDVFFDMEGYPYAEGGLEYLFGVSFYEGGTLQFKDWWAHDAAQEKRAFENFMDWAYQRWQQDNGMHIYHYAEYEITALKRLMSKYGTRETELDELLRQEVFINLYTVVRQGIRVGVPSYSIKKIERIFRPSRETDVATAMDSVTYYHDWLSAPDGQSIEESKLLRDIRDYNRDDCDSTAMLANWLREVQQENSLKWHPPEPVQPNTTPNKQARDAAAALAQSLLARLPAEPAKRRIHELLAHLLEFHWRESKPVFWAKYDRAEMTDEQLVEDSNCLGGLVRTKRAPEVFKQSLIYEYSFDPAQETKLDGDSKCFLAQDTTVGVTIHELNMDSGLVSIKLGKKVDAPPERIGLIPNEFVDPAPIAASIFRVVRTYSESGKLARPLLHLLSRSRPQITGCEIGPIVDAQDVTTGAIEAALNLDRSTLCIQGPPGSGKTYTGARMILDLLRAGKRVGVASHSHKAIANLLKEVDVVADENGIAYSGTKIQSKPEDFHLDETKVAPSKNMNDAIAKGVPLVGGTAWAFSDEAAVDYFDYLFVDEAGQVSLANLVGMSPSARNLVIMGDQMQLGQPLKGSHPGESGQSALEYLLQEHQTIPPDFGIFLGTTYRMHPHLCKFVSSAVYESRLHSAPQTSERLILLPNTSSFPKSSGILFVPVLHEGNTQCSEEEAQVIQSLIKELTAGEVFDKGVRLPLLPSDILVVAPYNMQVRLLKQNHLPEYVGTVDKFQGQQAIVVILSMCASDGNDLARGLEFLFSKNRLNVAISRAKCLAVVVGHPRLAATSCTKVEQMELINLYCRLVRDGQDAVKRTDMLQMH
jgi:predicted RecB family nuclease